MRDRTICLGLSEDFGLPAKDQMRAFREAGFNGVFAGWREGGSVADCARMAQEAGLHFQSVHAPFRKMRDMWGDDARKGEDALSELMACLRDCAEGGSPIMVCHAFIGFDDHSPAEAGLARFGELVRAAEKTGVRIAFENTEGEEYLDALMAEFRGSPSVGFCWDSGHEMCYNGSRDMLAKYGDRLIATHLNDNLGVRDPKGGITWLDDLHLLPFDGMADWDDAAARLDRCGFRGPMTFELKKLSRPGRHDADKYARMPLDEYLAEAYARACRLCSRRAA